MNNAVDIVNSLPSLAGSFETQNTFGLKFEQQCLFARQQITKNDFTMKVVQGNPGSLKSAVLNVAAIGISLNPASQHAYLVPRDGMICLDVSYRGLVKLATDSGAIEWAKAVLVYAGDKFTWKGPAEMPEHEADVFNPDRVDAKNPMATLKGGYCVAKLSDGSYMTDTMTAAEISKVANTSKAKNGPWRTWPEEMAKKTLVKRAAKSWPQSNGRDRIDQAVSILNEHEGIEEAIKVSTSDYVKPAKELTEKYLEYAKNGDPVDFYLWKISLDESVQAAIPDCEFEKGKKTAIVKTFVAKLDQGRHTYESMAADLLSCCESGDDHGVIEIMEDISSIQKDKLLDSLNTEQSFYVQNLIKGP